MPGRVETRRHLTVGERRYAIQSLTAYAEATGASLDRLPFCLKVLLENLLRHEDGEAVTADDGTAPAAQIEGYRVAGKTGTAWRVNPQTGTYIRGQNTISFMGFAPADNPRFVTYVVIDKLTLWQAASSPAALKVILVGVVITVPAIAAYTVFAYRVFRGKATELSYG